MYMFLQPKVEADLEAVCKLMGNYSKEVRVNALGRHLWSPSLIWLYFVDEPIASCC